MRIAARGSGLPAALWLAVSGLFVIIANILGIVTMRLTFEAFGAVSPFAIEVRTESLDWVPYYNALAFPLGIAAVLTYVWPVLAHLRSGAAIAPVLVRRRVVSAPLVIALIGLLPWVVGCIFFPGMTVLHFGRWSLDLASQQIVSPLMHGFLAATTSYLLNDWLFRAQLVPLVFQAGRVADVQSAMALRVRGRLLIFLAAVAFAPLFTMLGLVRATVVRVDAGAAAADAVHTLTHASEAAFVVYLALGIGLTLLVARTLTYPLATITTALRRLRQGELEVAVPIGASDELGVLEESVNDMAATLRDKERILQTFGRVVDPDVRDHLLSGELRLGGEVRHASILFVDLRRFTTLAEQAAPADVVSTLNEFFTHMTAWVRECGGFVDKFIGDAMLVVFGLFESDGGGPHTAGAAAAVRCALGMVDRVAHLNRQRAADGRGPLAVAISVHSGEVVAGCIGATDRHEYTVIGDAVNVAARLQQVCKDLGHTVVVSETTYRLAQPTQPLPDPIRRDAVTLRGRSSAVPVLALA